MRGRERGGGGGEKRRWKVGEGRRGGVGGEKRDEEREDGGEEREVRDGRN